ncbi:MAG TPA: hypothetical protein VGI05_01745 [Streptosporangiaceae bacterium]
MPVQGCQQWSTDYARDRKRRRTGRSAREWSPAWRNDPTEYLGADVGRRIWTTRYVKILDEEDPKAADVISAILGDVA